MSQNVVTRRPWIIIIILFFVSTSHSTPVTLENRSQVNLQHIPLTSSTEQIISKTVHFNALSHQLFPISDVFKKNLTIFGIHSSLNENISLCRWNNVQSILMNGSDFGLAITNNQNTRHPICLYNPNTRPLNVLLIENYYQDSSTPIPGGCNIEFPLEISPFIYVQHTNLLLISYLTFQRSAIGNESDWKRKCGQKSHQIIEYHIYSYYDDNILSHNNDQNPDEDEHFHRLISMSNIEWIMDHSSLITKIDFKKSFFRLYFTSNLNRKIYFNIVAKDVSSNASSIYVPTSHHTKLPLSNILFISTLVLLAVLSTIVSIIGYRYFILEIFYFTFILVFGLSFALLTSKIPKLQNLYYIWIYSFIFSFVIASLWTLFCRWSRNIRLALSLHSIVLSFWIVALILDCYLLTGLHWHPISELYLNLYIGFGVLIVHLTLFYFLDLFWLSALSTSIITVYLQMLPFDCFLWMFDNMSLFRIIYNIWLHNNHLIDFYPIVNLIILTKNDLLTFICFMFCVSLSITWQIWSKIGNLSYGFVCMPSKSTIVNGCISTSSSSPSSVKTMETTATDYQLQQRRKIRQRNRHNQNPTNNNRKKKNIHRRRRCRYCNKISYEDNKNLKRAKIPKT